MTDAASSLTPARGLSASLLCIGKKDLQNGHWLGKIPSASREPNLVNHYDPTTLKGVTVKPHGDRILVKPDAMAGKTEGGIFLPESVRGKPTRGRIVAVGPGRISQEGAHVEMPFKVGQHVLYAAFSETGIKIDGEDFLILREPDIYAVLEPVLEPANAARS